jgi:DNA-binding beta-propeller fold protein YncE
MPSSVARLSGQRWAILDGVNNRVVITDDSGQGLSTLGEDVLDQPLGLTRAPNDQLWVADSGHRRIVVFTDAGRVSGEFEVPAHDGNPAVPVDLAFDRSPAATLARSGAQAARALGRLLVVDNHNDRILSLDTLSGQWGDSWGSSGAGLEEMNHPFSIAVGPKGERAVVDVLNSRVISHDPEYNFTFQIGQWGVDAGDLYRPKGVAFDARGRVWVSDSFLGVIQVFAETGELVGVMADGREVRHFNTPTRLAFDERGRLAVVEMRANRVSLWEVPQ